jgi:hypothetical protein
LEIDMADDATLTERNPAYSKFAIQWKMMRDTFAGEETIKFGREMYLPIPSSYVAAGMNTAHELGSIAYEAYLTRAVFHDIVMPAVNAMVGTMLNRDWTIEAPGLEAMLENCTLDGENINTLIRRMLEEQLLMGGIGLLLDCPDADNTGKAMPFISTYVNETIIDWSTRKDKTGKRVPEYLLLDESMDEMQRATVTWAHVDKYRVLAMAEFAAEAWAYRGNANEYVTAQVVGTKVIKPSPDIFRVPSMSGKAFDFIPFLRVGSRDLVLEPDVPPLIALARIALAMYRTEADLRQALFMQGQDLLVVVGAMSAVGKGPQVVGAVGRLDLPLGGKAEYIGTNSDGIPHLLTSIENDKKVAANLGANMIMDRGGDTESGDALAIRKAGKTASLTSVVNTGAEAIKKMLQNAAVWKGVDPKKIVVRPNLEFQSVDLTGKDMVDWMTAKNLGLPIAKETLHALMKIANKTSLSYEDEESAISTEGPAVINTPQPLVPVDPNTGKPVPKPAPAAGGKPKRGAPGAASKPTEKATTKTKVRTR